MFFPFFDPWYFVILSPAILLMMWAQWRIKSAYAHGMQVPTQLSGAQAARQILDDAGLDYVDIEEVGGTLSDHYDPRGKVLRLSSDVYRTRSAAAVGIAAHEAGHAIQDAKHYAPLVLRNLAVPAAQFGPMWFMGFLLLGMFLPALSVPMAKAGWGTTFLWVAVGGFAAAAVFQIINLPVEFDASNRAKRLLTDMGMVDRFGGEAVANVLNAAAWTYVAGTLQAILVVFYWIMRLGLLGGHNRRD
ncbi:zinc metallopeptidase [Planctomicrobium sp. SH661]|uniref:zinc metallopeptidase n=1 Tax=Planctomicrobium sp. SH661 TaxID=3448124 RepID=UPI003F5BA157